jgi:hypothetical protein
MERTFISMNLVNIVTITAMALIGYVLLTLAAQLVGKTGKSSTSSGGEATAAPQGGLSLLPAGMEYAA